MAEQAREEGRVGWHLFATAGWKCSLVGRDRNQDDDEDAKQHKFLFHCCDRVVQRVEETAI